MLPRLRHAPLYLALLSTLTGTSHAADLSWVDPAVAAVNDQVISLRHTLHQDVEAPPPIGIEQAGLGVVNDSADRRTNRQDCSSVGRQKSELSTMASIFATRRLNRRHCWWTIRCTISVRSTSSTR